MTTAFRLADAAPPREVGHRTHPVTDWMRMLGEHHAKLRAAHPEDELCIIFDIDGTILDTRYLVMSLLHRYDRERDTTHFAGIRVEDIFVHETDIAPYLATLPLSDLAMQDVREWYEAHLWEGEVAFGAFRPYPGVFSVIRWFQLQPMTVVGINTGRPESSRDRTVPWLNSLAAPWRVRFADDLVFMNPGIRDEGIEAAKVVGLRGIQALGLRVVAVVDNEPANLHAMAQADTSGDVLFLHADTIFTSRRQSVPRLVTGTEYDVGSLIQERDLQRRVQFVWQGVNDPDSLRRFLVSEVRWAGCNLHRSANGHLRLQRDEPVDLVTPLPPLDARTALTGIRSAGRGARINLREGGEVLEEVLDMVSEAGFSGDALWFDGDLAALGAEGIRRLHHILPKATLSVPADLLIPLVLVFPDDAERLSHRLMALGVTRLSLRWPLVSPNEVLDRLEGLGWEVDLRDLPDLAGFLEAALLLPTSVTTNFDFPRWDRLHREAADRGTSAIPKCFAPRHRLAMWSG